MLNKFFYLFPTIFIFLHFASGCNHRNTIQKNGMDAGDSTVLFFHNNRIEVAIQNDFECILKLNKKQILSNICYKKSEKFLTPLNNIGLPGWFIIHLSEGDSCPSTYAVLSIKSDNTYFLSQSFGNCNEFDRYQKSGDSLIFQFGSIQEVNRRAQTIILDTKNFKVLKQ